MNCNWHDLRSNPKDVPKVPGIQVLICYISSGKRMYSVMEYSSSLWKYFGVIGWKFIDDFR